VNDFLTQLMIEGQTTRTDDGELEKHIRKMNVWPDHGPMPSGGIVEVTQTWEQLNLRGTSPVLPEAVSYPDIKNLSDKTDENHGP
jgi:hypothetical protein